MEHFFAGFMVATFSIYVFRLSADK